MLVPAGVKVHIALGVTDLRKGLDGIVIRPAACSAFHGLSHVRSPCSRSAIILSVTRV